MGSSSNGPDAFQQDEEKREADINAEEDRKNRQIQQDQIDQLRRGRGGFSPASGGSNQTLGG